MDSQLPRLTLEQLKTEAIAFAQAHASYSEPSLAGLDYIVIEPYYLHRFKTELATRYTLPETGEEEGITFPDLKVDGKFVNDRLEDSYSPLINASQMFLGLGYDVLIFVYHQQSDFTAPTVGLDIKKTILIQSHRTADWLATKMILRCLKESPGMESLISFFETMPYPITPGDTWKLSEKFLKAPPEQGYTAIGRAMKWHIRWGRVIQEAGNVEGIIRLQ